MNRCSDIHNNGKRWHGSDAERLTDLDKFLASSFDPDISDNEEEVGENADSLGLDLRALSLQTIFVGYPLRGFESETVTVRLYQ